METGAGANDQLTLDDVADRAGVEIRFARALVDAGVIVPRPSGTFNDGAVRRVMLVGACVEAGLPLNAIGRALDSGHLTLGVVEGTHYERWGQYLDATWEETSASFGVPLDVVQRVFQALGYGVPRADDRPRSDDPAILRALSIILSAGWDEDALVRLMRVYGESMRRITRTETQLWHEYVDVPIERMGGSQREVLESGEALGEAVMDAVDASVQSVYRRMQEHAWMDDLVEHIELALVEAGSYTRPERPVAMAFMDMSGYTALTEERGDRAAAELASSLTSILQRVASAHDGEAMKWLGDGVMFRFRDPTRGVLGALEVVEAAVPTGLPPLHVGMHAGAVVVRDGDVFRRTVNLAARISGVAGPGQVLVTREVTEIVGLDAGVRFEQNGPAQLKGVAAPVDLFRVER